jgi:hypothetical protein
MTAAIILAIPALAFGWLLFVYDIRAARAMQQMKSGKCGNGQYARYMLVYMGVNTVAKFEDRRAEIFDGLVVLLTKPVTRSVPYSRINTIMAIMERSLSDREPSMATWYVLEMQ